MAKRNYSSKRNAIYNAVSKTQTHPSARLIYEKLKPDIPDLSLGTVYRNIALFKEEGKIKAVCYVNGEERIDANTEPHPHFVCNKCGGVFDVEERLSEGRNYAEILNRGFFIESRYTVYYGLCPECCVDKTDVSGLPE